MRKDTIVYFGSKKMIRTYCPNCQETTLVAKGTRLCCDSPYSVKDAKPVRKKREGLGGRRTRPPKKIIDKMLLDQDFKCFYCLIPFGTFFNHPRTRKLFRTRVCLDHLVPYSYSQNNEKTNFVCACQICNSIKSNLMFESIESARVYVAYKRNKKGYTPSEEV